MLNNKGTQSKINNSKSQLLKEGHLRRHQKAKGKTKSLALFSSGVDLPGWCSRATRLTVRTGPRWSDTL